jgi:hypothetical protein
MSASRNELRVAWESLIAQGVLVPTGEMRPSPKTGELQPVYVHRHVAREMGLPLPPLRCDACEGEDADIIDAELERPQHNDGDA